MNKSKFKTINLVNGKVDKMFKVLASTTRCKILKIIARNNDLDVTRIAERLKQTEANISAQIKILEKVSLINSHYEPGRHGVRKVCELACERLIIYINKVSE